MAPTEHDPTQRDPNAGAGSADDLFALLYRELHTLASRHLSRHGFGVTLSTTTLLHEVYLNLAERSKIHFPDRCQFLGYASRAMRGLIIDYARRRSATKRGGEFQLLSLEQDDAVDPGTDAESLTDLSDALDQLARVEPALAELVDLHFFCGLSLIEIAALRGAGERTVQRDWRTARLLLHRDLQHDSRR